jgi:acyl carrier protein
VGEGLARRLEARGREVVRVPADAPEDFPALLRELRAAGKTVDRIVHLGNITADAAPAMRHPAPLLLALAEAGLERPVTVGLVANHLGEVTGGEPIDPSRAPLLVPILGKPLANLTCRAFDLAPRPDEDDLDLLVADLERDGGEPLVAFRSGLRWVRTWERAEAPVDAQALRPGGTYLIAGPLDAIGFALASDIARETKGRLVLTEAPAELHLQELRTLGTEVFLAAVPAAELQDLHGILDLTALHPTGTPEEAVRAAAARLGRLGTLAAGSRPDFCLLLAPLASLLGSPENPAAAATALFLEHLAQASRRNAPVRCTVINLDPTGAEAHAVEVFRRALAVRGAAQIAVSPEDLTLRIERSRQEGETLAPGRSGGIGGIGTPGGRHARPALRNAYAPPSTETETRIAAIFQELLGIEAVGIHDSFFELGGHSLLATQVVSRLRDRLGVELPAPVLFEEPSVAGLAGRVERERESAPAVPAPKLQARRRSPGPAEDLLARLDQLSDAEVQELLRQKRAALTGEEAP